MTKVHPNANAVEVEPPPKPAISGDAEEEAVLTVWRKSLLFNGNGFTVFDGKGNIVFRVDNYASENKGEIVLMDAAGKPLLTIRRKKLSLSDHWLIYEGEESVNPRYSVKKHINILHSKSLAHITPCSSKKGSSSSGGGGSGSSSNTASPCSSPKSPTDGGGSILCGAYEVEGSYSQRCCTVYDDRRRQMAEIRRKESSGGIAFGLDVFRLVVQPNFDTAVAMAIVILLEQMFGSKGSLMKSLKE